MLARIIRFIKLIVIVTCGIYDLQAEPYGGWIFLSEGDVVVLGGYRGYDDYYNASGGGTSQKPNSGSIEIPSHSYDGKPLVAIRACAFAYWDGVQEFIIPSTVTNLSAIAFQRQHPLYSYVWYGLSSVTSLVFKGNAPDIINPSEFKESLPNCTVYVSVSSSGWGVDIPGKWNGLPIRYLSQSYTVKFNANGGSGTMSNQSFAYGEAKNLTANAFTRTGYTFQGWATSASGAKVYSDKQSVSNLTKESNATVNLYAVWEKVQSEFSDSDITITRYSGKYDGIAHGVVATSEISGFEVKYCVTKDGPFEVASPTIKNVGSMMVWCELSAPGYVTTTNSATVTISPREMTLTSASASKVYDGLPLQNTSVTISGDGFVSGEGATYNVTGSQTSVGSSENSFTYTFKGGTKAENYTITTQTGLLTVTAASIGGGASGGEEPGNGVVPQGGLSKFDTIVMYDGKAHTIDTNALLAVTLAGSTPVFSYALAEAGPWQSMSFVYTNVCATSFWYKISAENYQDYIHEARLTISPRTGVVVDIIGNVATNMFNNVQQSVSGYQVSINDPLYSESDFEFTGSDTVSKIAVGEYPMGLSATQFANTNVNFTDVVFNVTDGELVILALPEKNVIFDAIGGALAAGEGVVTQKCDAVYRVMPTPMRAGYRFEGWYLGVTNAAPEAAEGAALLVNEEHTLFAKWGVDVSIMPGGESIFKWVSVSLDTVRILGFKDSLQTVDTLVFPDTIDGKAVVEIATGAFANSKSRMRKVILPIFCTRIGDKAFNGVSSLAEIKFVNARQWSNPSCIAELDIGRYAFAGAGVCSLMLPASVAGIGDYAFANCKSLSAITILGQPAIGLVPFRRAGMNTDGIIVHLDPALANNSAYMDSLKQECASVTVRADAVVTGIALSQLSLAADEISLSVSVEKAASWGTIDPLAVKVSFRKNLSDEPLILDPISVVENEDGSLTVKVASQGTESGFF